MYEKIVKRGIDIALSALGLILLSWLFIIIAIAIVIDDPGPVMFKQKRVARGKAFFALHKFRSMKMSTPHDTPTHLLKNPEQYITRVGKFLRKSSLDELPQIWDIFVGNMSIIGPRPALWNQEDLIAERDRYGANDVRPGLTGWAQINGRDELEIPVKAKLDGEYVRKLKAGGLSAFLFDCKCFVGTIFSVVKSDGVVEGGTGKMYKAKKKILVLTNHSFMLWRFRKDLLEKLAEDHEVVIGMPFVGHEDDFAAEGFRCIDIQIDRRSMNPIADLKLLNTYRKLIKSERPDMVLTYSIKPNIYAGLLCNMMRIPFCANVQGLGTAFQIRGLAEFVTMLYTMAFKKVRTVFFENESNAQEFLNRKIVSSEKVKVLPGAGIDLEEFEYAEYPENDVFRFLYLGRVMKEKGMDELFAACEELRAEGERFRLDLVGFFEDAYKERVEELEEKEILKFHGFQSDPKPYYRECDCVVLPSYHEGMSNVLLEAAAIGRPVITSDIPGCNEAVSDGVSGMLCEKQDIASLKAAMKKLLRMSVEERRQMGLNGRRKMEDEFEKKKVVRETISAMVEESAVA